MSPYTTSPFHLSVRTQTRHSREVMCLQSYQGCGSMCGSKVLVTPLPHAIWMKPHIPRDSTQYVGFSLTWSPRSPAPLSTQRPNRKQNFQSQHPRSRHRTLEKGKRERNHLPRRRGSQLGGRGSCYSHTSHKGLGRPVLKREVSSIDHIWLQEKLKGQKKVGI